MRKFFPGADGWMDSLYPYLMYAQFYNVYVISLTIEILRPGASII